MPKPTPPTTTTRSRSKRAPITEQRGEYRITRRVEVCAVSLDGLDAQALTDTLQQFFSTLTAPGWAPTFVVSTNNELIVIATRDDLEQV